MRKIVLGHSIAAGFMDYGGGWPVRAARKLGDEGVDDPDDFYQFYNLATSGFTTEDVLRQLPAEIGARNDEFDILAVLHIGINDPIYDEKTDQYRVNLESYRENMESILDILQEKAEKILVVGEPPIELDGELPWEPGEYLWQEDLERYEKVKREICESRPVEFVPTRKRLGEEYLETLRDGLHPGPEGHEMIAEVMAERLERMES